MPPRSLSSLQCKLIRSHLRLILNNTSVPKTTMNLSVLKTPLLQCQDLKDLKQILSQMILNGLIKNGLIKNKFAAKTLVKFSTGPSIPLNYFPLQIFNLIENPDASICNIMIIAYVRRNYPHGAIHFYKLMLSRKVGPNVYTYPFLLEACAIRSSKFEGPQIHNHVIKLGFDSDVHVRSTLVDMYVDCNAFDGLKVLDVGPMMGSFVWYSLLEKFIHIGRYQKAEYIYNLMPEKNAIATSLMMEMFTRYGMWEKAEKFMNEIPENDTVSWSALIYSYAQVEDCGEPAFDLFIRMHADGITIDEFVVEAVLHCCVQCTFYAGEDIEMVDLMGKLTHCLVMKIGIECDVELQNSLIRLYSKLGKILYAQNLFDAACWLHQSSWTFLICGYLECDLVENARALFESMPKKELATYMCMISYYSDHDCFSECLALFQKMLRSGIRPEEDGMHTIFIDLYNSFANRDSANDFASLDLGKCLLTYSIKNCHTFNIPMQSLAAFLSCVDSESGWKEALRKGPY